MHMSNAKLLAGIRELNVQDVSAKRGWFPDPQIQERWEIPDEVIIKVAISGRSASEEQKSEGDFPTNVPTFIKAASTVIEAGAVGVHFDLGNLVGDDGMALDAKRPTVEVYKEILMPLREKHGKNFVVDLNILRGNSTSENLRPVTEHLAEVAPLAAGYNKEWVENAVKLMQDNGCKPEIVIHGSGEVGIMKRRLIDSGILEEPYYFIVLIGNPCDSGLSPFAYTYMPNPIDMCKIMTHLTEQLNAACREPVIVVCAAGRASNYLATLAMMMGLHVRVGTEDTVWRYPHKNEVLASNREAVENTIRTAKILGRTPATAEQYRRLIGL